MPNRRRPARQVMQDLAEIHGLTYRTSRKVNYAAFARRTGIPGPSISRICRGVGGSQVSGSILQKLVTSFNITHAQARGLAPIRVFGSDETESNDWELSIIGELRTLSGSDQDHVTTLTRIKSILSNAPTTAQTTAPETPKLNPKPRCRGS